MVGFASYLRAITEKGGPEPGEFDALDACFHEIAGKVREGAIRIESLLQLWRDLGDAFSSVRTLQGHVVARPYGYNGDFELMDKIYTGWISPEPMFATWDRYFHSQEATRAVVRRKQYCVDLVRSLLGSDPLTVLSLGCGPAREVADLCSTAEAPFFFECVDQDPNAIAYARKLNQDCSERVKFTCRDVLRFRSADKYDLIWGGGIFDYFDDRVFSIALKRLLPLLRPSGRLVVANFSPHNPSRDYMECGQWLVSHRTKDQLWQLAVGAGVASGRITIEEDVARVVNYVHIRQQ